VNIKDKLQASDSLEVKLQRVLTSKAMFVLKNPMTIVAQRVLVDHSIETVTGTVVARVGDWIVEGETPLVVRDEIFRAMYAPYGPEGTAIMEDNGNG